MVNRAEGVFLHDVKEIKNDYEGPLCQFSVICRLTCLSYASIVTKNHISDVELSTPLTSMKQTLNFD